jgi:hypothetical protein
MAAQYQAELAAAPLRPRPDAVADAVARFLGELEAGTATFSEAARVALAWARHAPLPALRRACAAAGRPAAPQAGPEACAFALAGAFASAGERAAAAADGSDEPSAVALSWEGRPATPASVRRELERAGVPAAFAEGAMSWAGWSELLLGAVADGLPAAMAQRSTDLVDAAPFGTGTGTRGGLAYALATELHFDAAEALRAAEGRWVDAPVRNRSSPIRRDA